MFHDPLTAMNPYAVHVAQTQQFLPDGNFGFYYNNSPQYVMNADDAYNYNYNNWCYNNSYGYVADQFVDLRNKENMFQLVNVEKNNVTEKDLVVGNSSMSANNGSYEKMDSRDENGFGAPKAKIPFHIASIPKPQLVYGIKVDNTNRPFMSQDGSRPIHPLEEYRFFHFIDKSVSNFEPVRPSPVGNNTFTLVQDKKGLMDLAAKLCNVNEFAVDLEHNAYRSYQGLTCLMQISTRTEDFIVDTLKLHADIGPYLRDVFQDPQKRKVMHGADKDILWLQRDFSIYVCNMFDTGQASRVLKLKRNSLEHLLEYFCGVRANKEYQTADWRLRPLTNEMLRYASEDTHYLLHIYDLMKRRLLSSSTDPNSPESLLVEVYKHSYDVCMQLYEKELTNKNSYLNIYGLHAADLNGQELAVVSKLFQWRDIVARDNDESTGYVLPNKNLIEIAKKMPSTIEELCGVLKNRHPLIDKDLWYVTKIIQEAKQNANAFEEVAATLKREHLGMEQAARDASKTSDEASITSAGSRNERQITQLLNIRFGTFDQKSITDLEKRKAADSRGTSGYARDCNYGAWASKGALETGGRSHVFPNSASQMTNRVMNRARG